ncbi:uncharacterized protein LOC127957085 [Carassius gibelio]|uniref:uncharacterized protein LOC127957085 n=1 Tax=Carassius gibelio TaxID=101364 RepID=UPI002279B662|nr:uncharacterized protein LOC127957085 [Carassius gibelio]
MSLQSQKKTSDTDICYGLHPSHLDESKRIHYCACAEEVCVKRAKHHEHSICVHCCSTPDYIIRAKELSGSDGTVIRQQDTFFKVPTGRLKLRDFQDGTGQLIFYERPDTEGPKLSNYSITPTNDPHGLVKVLTDALGQVGQVKKERRLYMVGQTRVHVDCVEGLGDFMELEVVMKEQQSREEGVSIANQLMLDLGVKEEDLIEGAYMDLLLKNQLNGHAP